MYTHAESTGPCAELFRFRLNISVVKGMCLLCSVPVAAVQFKVRGTFYNMNRVQDGYFTLGAVSGQVTPCYLALPLAGTYTFLHSVPHVLPRLLQMQACRR